MSYVEASPLPEICENCKEEDCYNCDYLLARWVPDREEKLRMEKLSLERAVNRMQRRIQTIDAQLRELKAK